MPATQPILTLKTRPPSDVVYVETDQNVAFLDLGSLVHDLDDLVLATLPLSVTEIGRSAWITVAVIL